MTSEKLEQRLASAVEKTAPNDVNGVLSRCEERKGTVIPMTAKKTTKRKWTTLVAACLAVMLLGGPSPFGREFWKARIQDRAAWEVPYNRCH